MSTLALPLPKRTSWPAIDWQKILLGGIVALLAYLALGPLVLLVYGMLRDALPAQQAHSPWRNSRRLTSIPTSTARCSTP